MISLRPINPASNHDVRIAQRFARINQLLNYGAMSDEMQAHHRSEFVDRYFVQPAQAGMKCDMSFITLGQRAIGHIWLVYADDVGTLENIFIAAKHRCKGYGAAILAQKENMLFEGGCRQLWVGSSVMNHDSKRFYQRHGWKLVGKTHQGLSYRWVKFLAEKRRKKPHA